MFYFFNFIKKIIQKFARSKSITYICIINFTTMKNIILIDFAFTSIDTLKTICDDLKINFDVLKKDKDDFKFYKVWIDIENKTMIAYSTTKRPNDIIYTVGLSNILTEMSSYQLKPTCDLSDLTVDKILDKISKYGMSSLLKEEKDFLEEASKN